MEDATILIVEDDGELKNLLQKRLLEYGYLSDAVENGEELLHKMDEKRYDLIILDIMLPGEDGLSLCRKLRDSSQKCPDIPIIFTSALGEPADRVVGLEMGADDYLPKPFIMRELIARIRSVLRRSSRSRNINNRQTQIMADAMSEKVSQTILFGKWKLDLFSRCIVDEWNRRAFEQDRIHAIKLSSSPSSASIIPRSNYCQNWQ